MLIIKVVVILDLLMMVCLNYISSFSFIEVFILVFLSFYTVSIKTFSKLMLTFSAALFIDIIVLVELQDVKM